MEGKLLVMQQLSTYVCVCVCLRDCGVSVLGFYMKYLLLFEYFQAQLQLQLNLS